MEAVAEVSRQKLGVTLGRNSIDEMNASIRKILLGAMKNGKCIGLDLDRISCDWNDGGEHNTKDWPAHIILDHDLWMDKHDDYVTEDERELHGTPVPKFIMGKDFQIAVVTKADTEEDRDKNLASIPHVDKMMKITIT